MVPGKILVILFAPYDANGVCSSIRSAQQQAVLPDGLCFALPDYCRDDVSGFLAEENISHFFFPYQKGLPAAADGITDEGYFLLLMGNADFIPGWDKELCRQYSQHKEKVLLSGSIWAHPSGAAEVCLPALKPPFEDYGITIVRGLPVVNGADPIRIPLADPAFVFSHTDFLRKTRPEHCSLSYTAAMAGYEIFLLSEACVLPRGKMPPRWLRREKGGVVPGTSAERFEKSCGIHWEEKWLSPKIQLGLTEFQQRYPQQLPPASRAKQWLKQKTLQFPKQVMPILATALVDLPSPRMDTALYCLRFAFLAELKELRILAFTGGSGEKTIRQLTSNTQNFPDRDIPPYEGMKPHQHFRRSKIMMMARAAARHPEIKYAAWVDIDILPHPLPAGILPDFLPISDGKIHMARVDGKPDTSFIYVPVKLIPMLKKETLSICEMDALLSRSFSETMLWRRIYSLHPGDFVFHDMPRRQLLFLSLFDREMISRQVTVYLPGKEENQHEENNR